MANTVEIALSYIFDVAEHPSAFFRKIMRKKKKKKKIMFGRQVSSALIGHDHCMHDGDMVKAMLTCNGGATNFPRHVDGKRTKLHN